MDRYGFIKDRHDSKALDLALGVFHDGGTQSDLLKLVREQFKIVKEATNER